MFAEIDPTGWAIIIAAVCVGVGGVITSVVNLVLGFLERKAAARRAIETAKKVEEVKTTLEESTVVQAERIEELKKVADETHTLVNNNMGVQLKLNMELSRWKADQGNDPAHIRDAEQAEKLYNEHMEKQAVVDSTKPSPGG